MENETLFKKLFVALFSDEIEEAADIYNSMKDEDCFFYSAKLLMYLYTQSEEVLLEDYLGYNGISYTNIPLYRKLKHYISVDKTGLAYEIANFLVSQIPNEDFLDQISSAYDDDEMFDETTYMIDYQNLEDKDELEKYRGIERDIILYSEIENYEEVVKTINSIKDNEYYKDNYKFLNLIFLLVSKLKNIKEDTFLESTRNVDELKGNYVDVLLTLFKKGDYYRMSEVVEMLDHDAIEYDILIVIVDNFLLSVKYSENKEKVRILEESFEEDATFDTILIEEVLHSLDINFLSKIEQILGIQNIILDENKDYYKLYQEAYKNKNYFEAMQYILLFKASTMQKEMSFNYDNLINELRIKLINYIGAENPKELNDLERQIDLAIENKEYRKAIDLINRYNYKTYVIDIRLVAKMAACLYEIGDYNQAIEIYLSMKDYLNKEDYIYIMKAGLELYDYQSVLELYNKYNESQVEEDPIVPYMASIACMHLGAYEEALQHIEGVKELNKYYYDVPNTCSMEEHIIRTFIDGNVTDWYELDDFVDYNLTPSDKEKLDMYTFTDDIVNTVLEETNKISDEDSKVIYLLHSIKILAISGYDEEVKELIKHVSKYLDLNTENTISEDNKKRYTFTLKNYRSL